MFTGFAALGGNVVIHNALSRWHAENAECPVAWYRGEECPAFAPIDGAPWLPWWETQPVPGSLFHSPYPGSSSSDEWSTPPAGTVTNLVPNPSIEGLVSGWGATAMDADPITDGTAFAGEVFMRGTVSSEGTSRNMQCGTSAAYRAAVTAGGQYTASVYLRSLDAVKPNLRVILTAYDAANAVVGSNILGTDAAATDQWARHTLTFTPAATVVSVRVSVYISGTATVGQTFDMDAVMVNLGPTAYDYGDGSFDGWEWSGAENASSSSTVLQVESSIESRDGIPWFVLQGSDTEVSAIGSARANPPAVPVVEGAAYDASITMETNLTTLDALASVQFLDADGDPISPTYLQEFTLQAGQPLTVTWDAVVAPVGAVAVEIAFGTYAVLTEGQWLAATMAYVLPAGTLGPDARLIENAPWYDSTRPDLSARFFGAYGISVSGERDSTRTRDITDIFPNGGQIGRSQESVREVRFSAILLARGEDALDYGMAWLRAVLSPGACGQHGTACGVTDLRYYAACPSGVDDEVSLRRYMHDVAVTSGPFVKEEYASAGVVGYLVEWTITSEHPWVYGETIPTDLPSTDTVVYQDVPYNLVPYPSVELGGDLQPVAINHMTNPSAETNITSWGAYLSHVSGDSPSSFLEHAQSTLVFARGTRSSAAVIRPAAGSALTGVARLGQSQTANVTGLPTGTQFTASIWAAISKLKGGPTTTVINTLVMRIEWRSVNDSSSGTLIEQIDIPIEPEQWAGAQHVQLTDKPAGANFLRVGIEANINWARRTSSADTTDIRLYCDAVAAIGAA